MKKNNLKLAFIFVLYQTPKSEVERLKNEIKPLTSLRVNGLYSGNLYFIDNTLNNRGYASGVNLGLKKAIKDGCNLFVIANPDISLKNLKNKSWFEGLKHFDILGLAFQQDKKTYYGGEIDRLRMSAGLIEKKPGKRFVDADFVSGSLMIIKKEVIDKIGFFDESYFMYYEDVDYCFRARKSGFKVGIDRDICYQHFETSKTNALKAKYLFFNHFKFLFRYGSFWQKAYEILRLPKTVIEEVVKRSFYLNFFSYNFFSILNKVLTFIQFIFLVRTFSPAVFGIYSLSWAHLGMFMPIVDFGTTNFGIINLPQEKKISFQNIFSLRFYLSFLVFVLSVITGLFLPYSAIIKLTIFLVSFTAFQSGFFGSLLIKLANQEQIYRLSLISFIYQLILTSFIILTTLITKNIVAVFLVIFLFYSGYGIWCYWYLKKQELKLKIVFEFEKFKKIISYSIIYLLISILARWYSRIDLFLLQFLKGEETVGIYSSAYKFLEALMFMITAYNLSALPMFVNFNQNQRFDLMRLKIKKDAVFLLMIGLTISLSFFVFSPVFLGLFFKEKYLLAIPLLKIIIFSLPLILLTSVFFNFFYTIKKTGFILKLMIFQLVYNLILNLIFIPKYSYYASAYISVLGEVINFLSCVCYFKKIQNAKCKSQNDN